jgi:maltooligosyltrehalose synthase
MIVGAWPLDLEIADRSGRAAFAERLAAWQQKALREAKLASDWAAVDEAYEEAARSLTFSLVAEGALPGLLQEIAHFVQRIAPAGAVNGLAQCLLRLTVPGVPDLYQGTELWDFSLVDPDNRRPVDWQHRSLALSSGPVDALVPEWRDGRIKQALIARVLGVRRRLPQLFADGDYSPVRVEGALADAVIAFVRRRADAWTLVVAPRLALRLGLREDRLALAPDAWKDTALVLQDVPRQPLIDAFDGRPVELGSGRVPLTSLRMPMAMALVSTAGSGA